MPNKKHQKKHMRQSEKRRERNRSNRAAFRTALKSATTAIEAGEVPAAETALAATLKVVGKTAKKGLIHKNKAARHQSRLQRRLNALKKKAEAPSA